MKKIMITIAFFMMLMVAMIVPAFAQAVAEVQPGEVQNLLMQFLIENSIYIVPVLVWLVNRFMPTKWRDPIVMFLKWLNTLVPDKKSGGGKHNI